MMDHDVTHWKSWKIRFSAKFRFFTNRPESAETMIYGRKWPPKTLETHFITIYDVWTPIGTIFRKSIFWAKMDFWFVGHQNVKFEKILFWLQKSTKKCKIMFLNIRPLQNCLLRSLMVPYSKSPYTFVPHWPFPKIDVFHILFENTVLDP